LASGVTAGATKETSTETRPRVELEISSREIPTNYIPGQFQAPSLDDPDYPAMQDALTTLSRRLFEEVRTKRSLSYAVGSGMSQRNANYGLLFSGLPPAGRQ
jgi:predicted Zn-dependent peptidase